MLVRFLREATTDDKEIEKRWTKTTERVLAVVMAAKTVESKELAKKTGYSLGTVHAQLSILKRMGLITKVDREDSELIQREESRLEMSPSFVLESTGNGWIDVGLVVLVDDLKTTQSINVTEQDGSYLVEVNEIETLQNALRKIFERIRENEYIRPTGNKTMIYDTVKRKFAIVEKISLAGPVNFLFSGGDLKVKYDEDIQLSPTQVKEYENLREKYKKVEGHQFPKLNDGNNIHSSRPKFNWNYTPLLRGSASICSFCGKERPCKKIHANNYPLSVGSKNFQNFFSNLSKEALTCSICELASLLAPKSIIYNLNTTEGRLFFSYPRTDSLSELAEFRNEVLSYFPRVSFADNSSIGLETWKYPKISENIIASTYRMYRTLAKAKDSDRLLSVASSKGWEFYLLSRSGNVTTFESQDYLDDLHWLFSVYKRLDDDGVNFLEVFDSLAIKRGRDWITRLREIFAGRLIRGAEVSTISERIVNAKDSPVRGLTGFLESYISIYKYA
ncbi:MAG: winged helix-turn-helix transcriptional regulator [Thaumarchaeota archaeon]|nr:winged helix-turn-helix transcriptional regulator [Nitrososphaerota archaeon]